METEARDTLKGSHDQCFFSEKIRSLQKDPAATVAPSPTVKSNPMVAVIPVSSFFFSVR